MKINWSRLNNLSLTCNYFDEIRIKKTELSILKISLRILDSDFRNNQNYGIYGFPTRNFGNYDACWQLSFRTVAWQNQFSLNYSWKKPKTSQSWALKFLTNCTCYIKAYASTNIRPCISMLVLYGCVTEHVLFISRYRSAIKLQPTFFHAFPYVVHDRSSYSSTIVHQVCRR